MDEVKFCSCCGKLTNSTYSYCPWCGKSLETKGNITEVFNKSLDKLEKIQMKDRLLELEKLEICLDNLEEEIEAFLSKASS